MLVGRKKTRVITGHTPLKAALGSSLLCQYCWLPPSLVYLPIPCSSVVKQKVLLNTTITRDFNFFTAWFSWYVTPFFSFWYLLVSALHAVYIIYFSQQTQFQLYDFPHIFPSITLHCPNIYSTLVPYLPPPTRVYSKMRNSQNFLFSICG